MKRKPKCLRVSPKLLHVLTTAYGLSHVGENAVCAEMTGWLRLSLRKFPGDMDNIYSLVWKCSELLASGGYSENQINNYRIHGLAPVLFYYTAHNTVKYDAMLLKEFESDALRFLQTGNFGFRIFNDLSAAIKLLSAYHDSGVLPLPQPPYRESRSLSEHFEELLSIYKTRNSEFRNVCENSLKRACYVANTFLWHMERNGVVSVDGFSHKAISNCFTSLSPNYADGGKFFAGEARHFLSFLFKIKLTPIDYSTAIPQGFPCRRKLRFGFTAKEISTVLGRVNRKTKFGKRDYTIMLIAARTGLRACDIACLRLKDIDWHGKEIRIVQQKTGVAHTVPLTAEVGNAIVDYFHNSRGGNDSDYMFPLNKNSREHIKAPTISALTTKYMNNAAIDDSLPYRGVHSFRRSFGKRLLDASLTPDMLMEMLGQVNLNSITPYTAIYEDGLKRCAIPLSEVTVETV